MRDIVVHSPGFRDWHASVRYAAQLAASMRASLTGLYVSARGALPPGPPLLVEELSAYAQDELHQAMLAGRSFAQWAGTLGVHETRWQVAIGQTADALSLAGDWHDVVVMQGNAPARSADERLICEVLLSGVACIAVPKAGTVPGRVARAVVAWNNTATANRALHAALPLLRGAEVALLRPPDRDARARGQPDALSHLHDHGVTVTAVETVADTGEAVAGKLLAYATDQRADLLVMGASGRRRLGEQGFGAITSRVLATSHLPVFLKH